MEFILIFIGGLLGSSHCVGMCGGFALSIGANTSRVRQNASRQLIYSAGRICTYAFLGAIAGYAGARMKQYAGTLVNVSAGLSILAGLLLVLQGLSVSGWLPKRFTQENGTPCLMGSFLKSYLMSSKTIDMLMAGILTGFLPCGLVYAFLALASASGHVLAGALVMIAFGIGTVPLMLATGISMSALAPQRRQSLFKAAAIVVMLTGILTVMRGVTFAAAHVEDSPIPCPFCEIGTD